MELINREIEELENGDTTYYSCGKLADLYAIRYFRNVEQNGTDVKEHKEPDAPKSVMPAYAAFIRKKQKYKAGELLEDDVVKAMEDVSDEIKELIRTLFEQADLPAEKDTLVQTVATLKTIY